MYLTPHSGTVIEQLSQNGTAEQRKEPLFSEFSCAVCTVRAVLKKREYGAKYTQNNFITAVRAMNEFCLKPR